MEIKCGLPIVPKLFSTNRILLIDKESKKSPLEPLDTSGSLWEILYNATGLYDLVGCNDELG